jgi:hypothetical protein
MHGIIVAVERDAPLQLKWEKGDSSYMSREDFGRWMSAFREDDTGVQRSFDDLASALASENISRRRALKLAGASLLGAAGLLGSANAAQAVPTCPSSGPAIRSCERRCTGTGTRKVCFCIRTVAGNKRCVYPCCSGRTCARSSQCRSGEVCMKSPCCGGQQCVKLCSERRPGYCDREPTPTARGASWS